MAAGLVVVLERAADGGPLLTAGEDESIAHVAPGVGIVLGESAAEQPGTLYITTRRLIWLSDDNLQKGYAVGFLSLSMHAISRDVEAFPVPCIYTQIEVDGESDYDEADDELNDPLETENHVEEDLSKIEEMRLVPRDPNVYIKVGVEALNGDLNTSGPDIPGSPWLTPQDEGWNADVKPSLAEFSSSALIPEQEGEGEWFFNVNEVLGRPIGEDNDSSEVPNISQLQIHDPRFEDAEEELEDEGHC